MIHDHILSTIGRTPLVRINRLTGPDDAEVIAKLEFFNPGGSVKDRVAVAMIEAAERSGTLHKGGVIVEPTSGNTGIGLAMAGAVRGYRVMLVMPETMSAERRALLKHLGAEIVLTPGEKGMDGAMAEARRLVEKHGAFLPDQFANAANPEVHHRTTAREIIEDLAGRRPDVFVCGVGTGGSIAGVGRALKESFPDITVVAVEPAASPVLSGEQAGPHSIQGIGAGFMPDNYDPDVVDEIIAVTDDQAMETARQLAQKEGILAGISSGAALFAAIEKARQAGKGKLVLTLFPDSAERYLSTDLCRSS
jgi:cysteine synthase A